MKKGSRNFHFIASTRAPVAVQVNDETAELGVFLPAAERRAECLPWSVVDSFAGSTALKQRCKELL